MEQVEIITRDIIAPPQFIERTNHYQINSIPIELDWMLDGLALTKENVLLETACGDAPFSRYLADRVKSVIATDASPEVLQLAERTAEKANIENIFFENALAEDLPFDDGTFDVVVSRFGIHQFPNPIKQINEMVRVCKVDGSVCIIDMVSPYRIEDADCYNFFERRRNPFHTMALTEANLLSCVKQLGLVPKIIEKKEIEVTVADWLSYAHTDPESALRIQRALLNEINGKGKTGLRPFLRDGQLAIKESWLGVACLKPLSTV